MKKKIILGLAAAGTALAMIPLFAAFEAHVINVTAHIENALSVSAQEIAFGTVFPEEILFEDFEVGLSSSFQGQNRLDDVEYYIKQKDKPRQTPDRQLSPIKPDYNQYLPGGQFYPALYPHFIDNDNQRVEYCHTHRPADAGDPNDLYYINCYPNLCPYLSKTPDRDAPVNDEGIAAFHRAQCDDGIDNDTDGKIDWQSDPSTTDPQCTSKYDDSESEVGQQGLVTGQLIKSLQDLVDTWTIDLHVPCFSGQCAQDNEIPADYELDPRLNEKTFGCDLWIEVTDYSKSTQCSDGIDNDADGVIDDQDLGCYTPQEEPPNGVYDPNDDDETGPGLP